MITTDITKRIESTYSQYNDGTVELEARFGVQTKSGFKPGVTQQVFNRIRSHFDKMVQPIQVRTTDYIGNNVRKTVTIPVGEEPTKIIWIQKIRLWNQDDANYGIRYSMSREIPVKPVDNFVPDVIREKNRYTYLVYNGAVQIDITTVNMIQGVQGVQGNKNNNDQTKYEVEIELVDPQGLKYFEQVVKVVLYRVLNTEKLYTQKDFNTMVTWTNRSLGSNIYGRLDDYPLVQARNLKLKDMVYGGLIGNKDTSYSVTHKTDGNRKMMVFHNSGIWLLTPPYSMNRIYDKEIPQLTGTILDGEVVPPEKRGPNAPKTKIWYLIFDCISWQGNHNIQQQPHVTRMKHAQVVANVPMFKSEYIYINTKTFRNFSTPQEFFSIMRDMFREQENLQYEQDGFMFTPNDTVYNPHSDRDERGGKRPLYRRILTRYPDICKWKPKEQLTIDFSIQWEQKPDGSRYIKLFSADKGKLIVFTGNSFQPYNDEIDSNHPMTLNLPNGTVVEYGWDYDRGLFIPYRVRIDKPIPNWIGVADDVWSDIHDPLDQDTMEGKNLTLMRKYHNRIKNQLFDQATTPTNNNNKGDNKGNNELKTLLDIGSGRGGDVAKWKSRFSKIVAVEPNQEHIVELKRRLELHQMTDRVRIVNTGGEDIETIYRNVREFIGDRVDVVSMMLSLSFFWRSQSMVNRLVNTITSNIKPDGQFIFLTIDGDLVEQTFEPAMETGPPLTELDLGQAKLKYYGDKTPKELHIHIEGTIVEDQTEWLVRLSDIILPLRKFGFDFLLRDRADDEKFLTEEEITLTQMYTAAIIGPSPEFKKTPLPEITQVIPGKETDPGLKTNVDDINLETNLLFNPEDKMNPMSPRFTPLTIQKKTEGVSPILLPQTVLPTIDQLPMTGEFPTVGELPPPQTVLPTVDEFPTAGEFPTVGELPVQTVLPTVDEFPTAGELPPPQMVLPTVPGIAPASIGTSLPPLTMDTLEMLGTNIERDESPEYELPLIPVDTYQEIPVTWYPTEKVVRIGSIGDGSCFFHSVLGGYYPPYQNDGNNTNRREFVKKLRRDIAYTLAMEDPEHPGENMWRHAANGQFYNLYEQQTLGLELVDDFGQELDFSLEGLQRLYNSTRYLGDEVYQYASDILGIDIYVMRLTNKNLYVHLNTSKAGVERKVVVISGNGSHYETIGVEREGLFQTVFDQNDPFILAIRSQITDEGGTILENLGTQNNRPEQDQEDLIQNLEAELRIAEATGDREAIRNISELLVEARQN